MNRTGTLRAGVPGDSDALGCPAAGRTPWHAYPVFATDGQAVFADSPSGLVLPP